MTTQNTMSLEVRAMLAANFCLENAAECISSFDKKLISDKPMSQEATTISEHLGYLTEALAQLSNKKQIAAFEPEHAFFALMQCWIRFHPQYSEAEYAAASSEIKILLSRFCI